jgi:hypothetical protein
MQAENLGLPSFLWKKLQAATVKQGIETVPVEGFEASGNGPDFLDLGVERFGNGVGLALELGIENSLEM